MAQPLPKEVLDSAVNPAEINVQSFDVERRGFSQLQVEQYLAAVGDALRDAQQREADMRRRLGKAVRRTEAAEQKLREAKTADTDDTARQIGDEVTAVLKAARDAGAKRIAAADKEADRILDEAKELREDAVTLKTDMQSEATALKTQLVADGEAEAKSLRAQAKTDADAMRLQAVARLEQSRAEGDNLIAEAEEARAQILEDLERRRRQARAQVERLRVGRDRLLRSYDVVRRTLDETTGELKLSLKEAKLRGDSAARTISSRPLATRDELEAELQGSQMIGRSRVQRVDSPKGDLAQNKLAKGGAAEVEPARPAKRKPLIAESKRGEAARIPAQPKAPAFAPTLSPTPDDGDNLEPTTVTQVDTAVPVSALSAADVPGTVRNREPEVIDLTDEAMVEELAQLADENLTVVEPSDEIEEVLALTSEDADDSESVTLEAGAVDVPADGLFAALRAQSNGNAKDGPPPKGQTPEAQTPETQIPDTADVTATEAAPEEEKQKGAPASEAVDSGDDQIDASADAPDLVEALPGIAAQRDAVIADAAKQLEKRLKRALADEQNELLAGLRKTKRRKRIELAGIVGDVDTHLSRYVIAINEVAAVTYGAGAALIDAEAKQGFLPAGAVEELLVAEVVSPIREQLASFDRMDVASADMHVGPVRSFYRQQKTDYLGDAATRLAHLLCVAGVCDALPAEAPLPWTLRSN